MEKTWLIFKHEYTRHVFRWRFLFILLSPALSGIFVAAMAFIAFSTQVNRSPVGYVDHAHVLTVNTFPVDTYHSMVLLEFLPFPDEAAARAALDRKEIQAYFVIPSDYRQTRKARLVYHKLPFAGASTQFENLLRINLLADQPASLTRRVMSGSQTVIVTTGETQHESINSLLQLVIPVGLSYIMLFSVMLCSGYLIQAIVEEKENRTLEILATSASPAAIMTGKILGLVSVGLTQLVVWTGTPLIGLFLFVAFFPVFHGAVNWVSISLLLLTVIPTFFLFSALIVIGVMTIVDTREGQSLTMLVFLPNMLPYFFFETLSVQPSGPLALFLSFFPFTAATTLAIRVGFAYVPAWQILLSAGILVLLTIAAFWLTARIFRKWMLVSGKWVDWKRIFRTVFRLPARKGAI